MARDRQDRFVKASFIGADTAFERLVVQVVSLIGTPGARFDLPLDLRGTAFRQQVSQALRDIPFGGTASYTEIARRIGSPKACRAVAQACGANPVSVAIPCHRAVRSDGTLSGYRLRVERKRTSLARESYTAPA